MPGPILHRATLLSFILLCAAVESPPPARATPPDPPATMQGFLRYKVRGLSGGAGVGPMLGILLGPVYMEAFLHRVPAGFLKILQGAVKLSGDASNAEVLNVFRSSGAGVDLSSFPVVSGSDAEIEFTLERVNKDEYRFKRGSYRWSGETRASLSGGEGGEIKLTDNFRGQASGALDPKTSSITLVYTGKKGSRQAELNVDVRFPTPITGKETYVWGPVATLITEFRGDRLIREIHTGFGQTYREQQDLGDMGGGVYYSKRGPPATVVNVKGLEIYKDLLDSGVTVEWELWSECTAAIKSPGRNEELAYNLFKPGQIVDTAYAEVKPSFWGDDLHWEFEEIEGSKLDPPPEKANGNDFDIIYTKLPEKNSAFKFGEVKARFDTDRAKRAGCKDPEPREVGYFFDRDGVNHGGPSGPRPDKAPPAYKPNPNWFHYWMQTKANPGLPINFVRYGGEGGGCGDENGYFLKGDKYIVLCDGAQTIGYNVLAPLNMPEGIDNFAATLLHENQHHDNYWEFWPAGYGTPANPNFDLRDLDRDDIPDLRESKLPVPPQVKSRTHRTKFSPRARDSFGLKITDEHVLAYAAEFRWKMGSAKKEDWSCPGQQTRICGL